ncbi:MAG: ABC transporter substrate-binding protein [Micromonosporaceae bacterium]|nr:ABC transporter substrate-binding protein [Micromonosporaceae bacterium]
MTKTGVRRRSLAACLAAVALAAGGCSAGDDRRDSRAPDKVTVLTAFGSFGREGYIYVAKERGYFAKHGIDATVEAGQGATQNLGLLTAGKAQFTVNDLSGVWILQGNGKFPNVRAVAAIQQNTLNSIMTLEASHITSARDLVGKTIGGTPGSTSELLWPAYAKLAGIDPGSVRWQHMPPQETPLVLAAGKVDGIGQFVVASGTVEKAAGGKKTRALAYSDVITDLYGNGIITTTKMIQENPDLVRRFRDAILEALVWSVEHPQEAGQILHQAVPATGAEAAAGELAKMRPYVYSSGRAGKIDKNRVARSVAILSGAGVINRQPSVYELVDFDFAEHAYGEAAR